MVHWNSVERGRHNSFKEYIAKNCCKLLWKPNLRVGMPYGFTLSKILGKIGRFKNSKLLWPRSLKFIVKTLVKIQFKDNKKNKIIKTIKFSLNKLITKKKMPLNPEKGVVFFLLIFYMNKQMNKENLLNFKDFLT